MFWLYVLLMIVLALFIVLFGSRVRAESHYKKNKDELLSVYKQQFDDLKMDVNNGTLTNEQAEATRIELEHALLRETENGSGKDDYNGGDTKNAPDWTLNGTIMLLLPVLAIAFYYKLGQPDLAGASGIAATGAGSQSNDRELPSIEELVAGLEQRLQQTPDDLEGLWMLTRTYMALGRFADAQKSVEQLYALSNHQAPVLLLYANVLMLNNEESFAGKPEELIQQALELEPESTSGLWLAGLAAQQRGENESAIAFWQRLLPLVAADEDASEEVEQLLAEVSGQVNGAQADETADSPATTGSTSEKAVILEVSLSAELQGETEDNHTLFVFARAADGLPMPLAVSRLHVSDLPVRVTLNDTMAMMPSRLLSGFENVEVLAHISKSGNAASQSGDLTSEVKNVEVGEAAPVKLIIDRIVD